MDVIEREISIDVLRWLALTGIIIVHISPSPFWEQIRSFDVPMMVFLSAYCFSRGSYVKADGYKAYCIKRFKRLVLPCWIFLIAYFFSYYKVLGHTVDWLNVVLCFSLLTPWYLWIIRIFVLMSLIAPLMIRPVMRMSSQTFFLTIVSGLCVNEVLCHLSKSYGYVVIIMTFSYLLVFIYGIYVDRLSDKQISMIGCGALLLFLMMAFLYGYKYGNFILVGRYKYPPSLYYLSYAYMCISFLWRMRLKITTILQRLSLLRIVAFIGSHTLWIYLWHIPVVSLAEPLSDATMRFAIVYTVAIIVTFIQSNIVKWLCSRMKNECLRRNFMYVFIG